MVFLTLKYEYLKLNRLEDKLATGTFLMCYLCKYVDISYNKLLLFY